MSKEKFPHSGPQKDTPQSAERRRFLETAGKFGFTTAVVAAAGGSLMSSEALAQTAKEESERKKAAKHTMTIATAYILGPRAAIRSCSWTSKRIFRTRPTAKST